MDIKCSVPDQLGKKAKELSLPFSSLLQDALATAIDLRDKQESGNMENFELDAVSPDEGDHILEFEGRFLGRDEPDRSLAHDIYQLSDGRFLAYCSSHSGNDVGTYGVYGTSQEVRDEFGDEAGNLAADACGEKRRIRI